ncbi:MAG: DUF4337 domain-containing protein [Thermodesulfobacteriota bacterium]
MAEEKDRWLNYLATTTVLLAVLATLSTFFGQKNSTRSVISEIKASNQWNYFQAKKIRSYLFEVQKEGLEIDLKMREETIPARLNEQMQKRVDGFGSKIAKWQDDMNKIEKDARSFEQARDAALMHSQNFGLAVVFLQLAILLSSIAALMKKKPVWLSGLVVGAAGLFYFANGFFLWL